MDELKRIWGLFFLVVAWFLPIVLMPIDIAWLCYFANFAHHATVMFSGLAIVTYVLTTVLTLDGVIP